MSLMLTGGQIVDSITDECKGMIKVLKGHTLNNPLWFFFSQTYKNVYFRASFSVICRSQRRVGRWSLQQHIMLNTTPYKAVTKFCPLFLHCMHHKWNF